MSNEKFLHVMKEYFQENSLFQLQELEEKMNNVVQEEISLKRQEADQEMVYTTSSFIEDEAEEDVPDEEEDQLEEEEQPKNRKKPTKDTQVWFH